MTSVGHTLVGLTLRNLATPAPASKRRLLVEALSFTALANLPDWSFPGWGHDAYHVSHSAPVLMLLMLELTAPGILVLRKLYTPKWSAIVWAGLCAAVLSHVLLDSLYADGSGLAMFWPLSEARVHLPISWFHHLKTVDGITLYNIRVLALEGLFYSAVLAASVLARRKLASGAFREMSPEKL
jgi:membrane-bound metal-dependent hydrolase YbcI (DUF457 family)